jgi:3-oxoacyl-[acyl-carrier-protein] synthase III
MYIKLRDALKDFLKEHNITIDDILEVMDEDPEGIIKALQKRTGISRSELEELISKYGVKRVNMAILALQVFYLNNPSGMYKGKLIIPEVNEIIRDGRVSADGIRRIILEVEPRISRK